MKASEVVSHLLDHCGHCPEDKRKRLKIGTGVEGEHTSDPKEKLKIAKTHMKENPNYYPDTPKPKGAKEALRWIKRKPKASFYPSAGGPSSM